jgi:hypothetical protein
MESIILVLVTGCLCIWSFLIGVKVGKAEKVEAPAPTVNPLKAYREWEDRKEAERQRDRIDTIMRNIDNYDGTSLGQEEVR